MSKIQFASLELRSQCQLMRHYLALQLLCLEKAQEQEIDPIEVLENSLSKVGELFEKMDSQDFEDMTALIEDALNN